MPQITKCLFNMCYILLEAFYTVRVWEELKQRNGRTEAESVHKSTVAVRLSPDAYVFSGATS